MSLQQEFRVTEPRDLPVDWGKPVFVQQAGSGRATTVVASLGLLAGLAALAVPVGAPLLDLLYPDHPVVKALNRDSRATREIQESLAAVNGRLAAQTARIEAIEANIATAAERLGRVEARTMTTAGGSVSGPGTGDVGELSARLSALEPTLAIAVKRIDALDPVGSNGKTFSARILGTEGRITEIDAALDDLLTRQKSAADQIAALPARFEEVGGSVRALEGVIERLGRRLEAVETASVAANSYQSTLRLAVALLQLNNSVQTHRPFARDLGLVTKLLHPVPDIREIEVLSANADSGVATVAELRDSFSVILAPKLRALSSGGDQTVVERVRLWVGSWILPQNAPMAKANPVDLLVDAATEKLSEEDVPAAIAILGNLDSTLAPMAARWLVEAKNRVAIDHAMDALLALSIEELSRSSNSSSERPAR
jgi:phage shock protein A